MLFFQELLAHIFIRLQTFFYSNFMNWVVCIKNTGFEASLEVRKLYNVEDDKKAQALGMIRVVDESGKSYLYPQETLAFISIQQVAIKRSTSRLLI